MSRPIETTLRPARATPAMPVAVPVGEAILLAALEKSRRSHEPQSLGSTPASVRQCYPLRQTNEPDRPLRRSHEASQPLHRSEEAGQPAQRRSEEVSRLELRRGQGAGPTVSRGRDEVRRSMFRGDGGVATVWTALAVAAVVWLGAAACWLGAAVAARHRVEAAADLGALAAAAHSADGPAKACERAREVADHQGAEVTNCHWDQRDALVEVRAARTPVPGLPPPTARARAGPVGLPN
ncbi:Rv3654c family TadE-like protein [Amycolatopsis sp. NBC_01480]|uniref:Rv3654c family TadE-like protein n=1 Tax=Amycolatopsis sp. NBC_01480 TaxID=2903562 RepID=UPI002E2D9130|nr:Rv3654c family TadE-like protein [Amycolatopsis sp. NBC_01480]